MRRLSPICNRLHRGPALSLSGHDRRRWANDGPQPIPASAGRPAPSRIRLPANTSCSAQMPCSDPRRRRAAADRCVSLFARRCPSLPAERRQESAEALHALAPTLATPISRAKGLARQLLSQKLDRRDPSLRRGRPDPPTMDQKNMSSSSSSAPATKPPPPGPDGASAARSSARPNTTRCTARSASIV